MTTRNTKKDYNPGEVVYTSPEGRTVTQRELEEIEQRAAVYCVRNHIYPFI